MRFDRRADARHEISLFAEVVRGAVSDVAYLENIGNNGALLRGCTGDPLTVGDRLTLRFRLPGLAEPVEIETTVRWVTVDDLVGAGVCYERGLRGREAWALNKLARVSE